MHIPPLNGICICHADVISQLFRCRVEIPEKYGPQQEMPSVRSKGIVPYRGRVHFAVQILNLKVECWEGEKNDIFNDVRSRIRAGGFGVVCSAQDRGSKAGMRKGAKCSVTSRTIGCFCFLHSRRAFGKVVNATVQE